MQITSRIGKTFIGSMLGIGMMVLVGAAAPEVQPTQPTRIVLPEKGFSIVPPAGWNVTKDTGSSTLLFEIPRPADGTYQRTIQVMVFDGPMPIDAITEQRFGDHVVQKMSASSPAISAYRIRSAHRDTLKDGQAAILYYAEFDVDGNALMQLHVLTSSRDHHYLVTYTDVVAHFEGADASTYLDVAWNSVLSISTDSAPPMRYEALMFSTAGCVILAGLWVTWSLVRKRRGIGDWSADPIGMEARDVDEEDRRVG